jgi:hypothetical protein
VKKGGIPMALKKYSGSCSCEKVRFETMLDLGQETTRCNCTVCIKMRFWGAKAKPETFQLISGKDDLSDYGFDFGKVGNVHHFFCKHCGMHPYGTGDLPGIVGKYISVNIGCLDNASDEELAAAPIVYMDGRHDKWREVPKITAHL